MAEQAYYWRVAMTSILIMCGGRGARLGDITKNCPKPLIKIGGVTILERKIGHYMRNGFKDFIVCIGYKADMIKSSLRKGGFSRYCRYSDSGEPAGILKRLYNARNMFDDNVVLTYGDTFANIDLSLLLKTHIKEKNSATIVVAPIQNPFGLVEYDNNRKVLSFKEKPVLNYYIGYAVINKSDIERVPQKMIGMPDGKGLVEFYKYLIDKGSLGIFEYSGPQITFNTEDELRLARRKMTAFYTSREET